MLAFLAVQTGPASGQTSGEPASPGGSHTVAGVPGFSQAVAQKSATLADITAELRRQGRARVLVEVDVPGADPEAIEAALDNASTRAATKARIRAAVDAVLARYSASATAGGGKHAVARASTAAVFSMQVTPAELEALARDPSVLAINLDRKLKPHLDLTLPLSGIPGVHSAGGTGRGYTVVVIDSGVTRTHPFFRDRILKDREACFLDTDDCPNGQSEHIGRGASEAMAGNNHGNHISGILVGNRAADSPRSGVARGANLIPINVYGVNDFTSASGILRAFEYVEDLVISSNAQLRIAAINLSDGGDLFPSYCDTEPSMAQLKRVIERLRARGVLTVASAGNEGSRSTIAAPSCLSSVISVAATSRRGIISSYSNISWTTDLLAPGGEPDTDCVRSSVDESGYDTFCGTSMAAPHVAGAITILKQKVPSASACEIEEALKYAGKETTDVRSGGSVTRPRIKVNSALNRLLDRTPRRADNDDFRNAMPISSTAIDVTYESSLVGATLEKDEPRHVSSSSRGSVWWTWKPRRSGTVRISTLGSGGDTVLAVYSGSKLGDLGRPVAENDNARGFGKTSAVTFRAVAGRRYKIVVAAKSSAHLCSVQLNLTR